MGSTGGFAIDNSTLRRRLVFCERNDAGRMAGAFLDPQQVGGLDRQGYRGVQRGWFPATRGIARPLTARDASPSRARCRAARGRRRDRTAWRAWTLIDAVVTWESVAPELKQAPLHRRVSWTADMVATRGHDTRW